MDEVYFILYVRDQEASTAFYSAALGMDPKVHVPGITEYQVADRTLLAVMPEAGIKRLLGDSINDPALARQAPRAEVYLVVDDPAGWHARALEAGATELRPLTQADWGHDVAYSLDPDGHVLAFARPATGT